MIGNPALSVLADAYIKGIRTFDVDKAYRYAVNTSARFGNDELGYTASPIGISHTLEYAYTDWCVAQLAAALGRHDDAAAFEQKAQAYRNTFDAEKGWFRPRRADGSWAPWPEGGRMVEGYGCIESNPYQQGWFVPHDVDGMVEAMGGREAVLADLGVGRPILRGRCVALYMVGVPRCERADRPVRRRRAIHGEDRLGVHSLEQDRSRNLRPRHTRDDGDGTRRTGSVRTRQPAHPAHDISLQLCRATVENAILGSPDHVSAL
jgi:hypothetical protein